MAGSTVSTTSIPRNLTRSASAVALLTFIVACNDASPTDQGVRSAAEIVNQQDWLNISFTVFVPCAAGGTGEDVAFSGRLHTVFHMNAGGGPQYPRNFVHLVLKDHAQPAGIKGTGVSTGTVYNAIGVTQTTQGFLGPNDVGTYVNVFTMIGRGPGNNFQLQEVFHVVVDPETGDVRVIIDKFSVVCGLDGGS